MQAIVFLTHLTDRRILRHFKRLRRETRSRLDAFFCLHRPKKKAADTFIAADLIMGPEDSQRALPARYFEKEQGGHAFNKGFVDLACFPAFLHPRLESYSHVWLVEYDVDYAGDWDAFFARTMDSRADFLGATIFPKAESQDWLHWTRFAAPPDARSYLRSFGPIFRLSRSMVRCYVQAVGSGHWRGHFEALLPTIALHHGLRIEDLGGIGPFCPPAWQGRNYYNTPLSQDLSPGTLVAWPVQSNYFHEATDHFSERELLYHPVKPRPSRARRVFSRLYKATISSLGAILLHLLPLRSSAWATQHLVARELFLGIQRLGRNYQGD